MDDLDIYECQVQSTYIKAQVVFRRIKLLLCRKRLDACLFEFWKLMTALPTLHQTHTEDSLQYTVLYSVIRILESKARKRHSHLQTL